MEIETSEDVVKSLREEEKRDDMTNVCEPQIKKMKTDIDYPQKAKNIKDLLDGKNNNTVLESEDCLESTLQESSTVDDPYGYLERGDFSSERFKLELCNLPKRFGLSQLRKKLVHLNVKPCKIKSVTLGSFAFVTFRTEEDRDQAIEILQGYEWKSRNIKVKMASAIPDPLMMKRKSNKEKRNDNRAVEKKEVYEDDESRVNATVAPLWRMPYDEQLKLKQETASECLRKISKDIYNSNKLDAEYINNNRAQYDGMCCCLQPIMPSPLIHGYRNKCEFTIGRYKDEENCVGFRVGCYKDGDLSVFPIHSCIHVPHAMKVAVKELEGFLKERLDLTSFDAVTRKGHLKQVVVRTASGGSSSSTRSSSSRSRSSGGDSSKINDGNSTKGDDGGDSVEGDNGDSNKGNCGDISKGNGGICSDSEAKVNSGSDADGQTLGNVVIENVVDGSSEVVKENSIESRDTVINNISSADTKGATIDNNNTNTTTNDWGMHDGANILGVNDGDNDGDKDGDNDGVNDGDNDADKGGVKKDQLLLTLVCHPQDFTEKEKTEVVESFRAYYKTLGDKSVVTSLHFQFQSDRKDILAQDHTSHIAGKAFITEQLLHMNFRISPLAFFQVNTRGAEVLYDAVGAMCGVTKETTLVDVCCGTGTIGLTMAKSVKRVIGIEVNEQAVADAKTNAAINGVTNAEFICSRVEDILDCLLRKLTKEGADVVVIVDPPRAGLHSSVVKAIRRLDSIKRLVYVACKLSAAANNLVDFTRQISKRTQGRPFRLMKASIIDLFPMTHLYESILLLERD